MIDKIKELLNSIGFWIATLGAFFQIMRVLLPQYETVWNILTAWLGVVFARGALDSAATKLGERKKSDVTITNPDKVIGVTGDVKGDIK